MPARVAELLGFPFASPEMPRPILLDLEGELRDAGSIFGLKTTIFNAAYFAEVIMASWAVSH